MASTGWILTARITGHSTAPTGTKNPMTATLAKMPAWKGVKNSGSDTVSA